MHQITAARIARENRGECRWEVFELDLLDTRFKRVPARIARLARRA